MTQAIQKRLITVDEYLQILSKSYNGIVSFMIAGKSPEEIIAFKTSEVLNDRVLELNAIEKKDLDQYMCVF